MSNINYTYTNINTFFSSLDPMNYFLLDAVKGELRTARPLDREALENSAGLLTFNIKVNN